MLAEARRIVPLLEDATIETSFDLKSRPNSSVKKQFLEYMAGRPTEAYVRRCLSVVVGGLSSERIEQEYRTEIARTAARDVSNL
jgi:hypothetical protein